MAISRIGGASNNAINAGAATVTLPGSMAVDDLILLAWSCGDDDFTQPTLAMTTTGYTELTTSTLSADGVAAGTGTSPYSAPQRSGYDRRHRGVRYGNG